MGSKEIIDRAFYSLKDTKMPAINGFIIMASNIALSLVFMPFMGGYGLPLAYSVSSIIGLCVLLVLLNKKIGVFAKGCTKNFVKCTISALVMYGAVTVLRYVLPDSLGLGQAADKIIILGLLCFTGVAVYGIMIILLKVDAANDVLCKIKRKFVKGGI